MRLGMKNMSFIVQYIFMMPRCPTDKLEGYSTIILSAHISGIARTAASFSGVIINNRKSNRMYGSASVSVFLIAPLEEGNLFCDKYKNTSLK